MRLIAILLLIILIAGCSSEKNASAGQRETLISSDERDLDNDGQIDVATYTFSSIQKEGIVTQRTVTAYLENEIIINKFNTFRDVDTINLYDSFKEFEKNYDRVDDACTSNLGTLDSNCGNLYTCIEFCSTHSTKCKRIAESFRSTLGHSMLAYVRDSTEIRRNLLPEINNEAPKISSATEEEREAFVENVERVLNKLASINANPVITQKEIALCNPDDYKSAVLIDGVNKKVADYSKKPSSYHYRITILVDRSKSMEDKSKQLSFDDLILTDTVPSIAQVTEEMVSSPDAITAKDMQAGLEIEWPAQRSSNERSLFLYEIDSKIQPQEFLTQLKSPGVKLKILNVAFLEPIVALYTTIFSIVGNYYIALALGFAITIVALLILVTLLKIIFNIIKKIIAKQTVAQGFYSALMRTTVQWKSDIVIGAIAFGVGLGAATLFAKPVTAPLSLLESIDFLILEPLGFVAILGVLVGTVLVYLSIENILKIYALEHLYGKKFRDERGVFINRATELKTKIEELKKLAAQMRQENFEVSLEDDLASSISAQHINEISKKMDEFSKREIEGHLIKIESALQRLEERRRVSQENWKTWAQVIGKKLEETGEVYSSGLTMVPSSLRLWALHQFATEHEGEGITLEGETLKRREVSADIIANSMIDKGLFVGVVLIKENKVSFSKLEGKSATVAGALGLKMVDYMRAMVKDMGQDEYGSLAIIGDALVVIGLRHKTIDALLLLKKEKFKDAIEEWKGKMKNF